MVAGKPRRVARTSWEGFLGGKLGRQVSHAPGPACGMGGRIEPAGPEPPPAHSLGRVGEDAMGKSGHLVLFFFIRYAINFVPFFKIFLFDFEAKKGQKSERNLKNTFLHKNAKK